jgi:hypothetical protein
MQCSYGAKRWNGQQRKVGRGEAPARANAPALRLINPAAVGAGITQRFELETGVQDGWQLFDQEGRTGLGRGSTLTRRQLELHSKSDDSFCSTQKAQ